MRVGLHEAIHDVGFVPSTMNSGYKPHVTPLGAPAVCEILVFVDLNEAMEEPGVCLAQRVL